MAMEISNWHELLSLVNVDKDLSKDNVIEKIQNELKRYSKEYEEWEKSGFDINYVFKDGEKVTLLHLAASCNLENIVNALIEKGANVNEKGAGGKTPLCGAVLCDNMVMVDALIKEGADVNSVDILRRTPLHWAALRGNMVMVDALIKKGADVNSVDMWGETPLHYLDRSAIKKGWIAGGVTALLGTAISIALFTAGAITAELIPIVIAVVAITVTALIVCNAIYKLSKPDTQVDKPILANRQQETASNSRVA
ncbi:ankyrin repeat domain-containing protein [Wolbachia pipientis]|uniref:ankyrin repeat domain-containing protein n=1 Tax=Wolbachia pipientis TaxID=955 RepID=UPI001BDAA2BF|nr:ankyrin repeat domain-containing protein [Wolbachia pipientis]UIP91429.1 ankyrin repeat domain-containing protein [Wolbachia pipientis]